MILVLRNNILIARHDDNQNIEHFYPGASFIKTSIKPVIGEDGQLAVEQSDGFSAETGLELVDSQWQMSTAAQIKAALDKAKHVTRTKLAALIDPVTGVAASTETDKAAIERDLQHAAINQTMLLSQPTTVQAAKDAIIAAQGQAAAILQAAKLVYEQVMLDPEYDYENSPLWP